MAQFQTQNQIKKLKMSSSSNSQSKTAAVQGEVDEVVNIMHDNINKVMQRGEQLDTLQNKTDDLQNSSAQFKRGASKVRKQMWWKVLSLTAKSVLYRT